MTNIPKARSRGVEDILTSSLDALPREECGVFGITGVEDVAELSVRMLMRRSVGALNAATGAVMSFRDIAELIAAASGGIVKVTSTPRSGPMPHNGYRPFEAAATAQAFPEFRYTSIKDGLVEIQEKING